MSRYGEAADNKMIGGFLVIAGAMFGTWGWGATLKEAKARFTTFGGKLSRGYDIFEFTPETEFLGVRQDGLIQWDGPEAKHTTVKARGQK